jgi:putative ABC transport system permease protein
LAGVESASLAATVPLGELFIDRVQRAGSPVPPPKDAATPAEGQAIQANYNIVSSDYFRTLGVALQRGREFEAREFSTTNLPRVAIINTALAEKLWPNEEVLGRRVQFRNGQPVEVVGIVSSFRGELTERTPRPAVFVPYAQAGDDWASMNLLVRALPMADATALLRTVRDEVRRIDPALPVLATKTLRHHVATNIQVRLISAGAWVFATLGAVAMLLAVLGVYGVKAYAVARRTREIGIRMALGASRKAVLGLILREGAKLTLVGLAISLLLAAAAARAISGFLFEVPPYDPMIFLTAPLLLTLPALLACWLPARRAAKVDPMVALRYE